MKSFSTTKLSSRGQVVIPEEIRSQMGLKEGHQFVVLGHGDTLILKTITPPSHEEFLAVVKNMQAEAKRIGLKKSDLNKAIQEVRRTKK